MDSFDQDPFGSIDAGQVAAPIPGPQPGTDRTRTLVLGGLIVLAFLAIGAVAFATMNASTADGAESPEAAMQQFFDGLNAEDMVASVEAFLPGEADPVISYMDAITTELERLEVVSGDADPQSIAGLDLEFTDLVFRTEPIADGFERVYVTNGNASLDIDQAELPLGSLLVDNLGQEMWDQLEQDLPSEPTSMTGEEFYLVAVDDGGWHLGGWHLSFWYTVMDAVFTDAGYGNPIFGDSGIEPAGADSPEAAVEAAFRELLSLDLEGLVAMLPPDEMRALYDYMPLVFDDFEETVGAFGSFVTIDLQALGTTVSDAADGGKRVKIDTFDIAFASFFLEIEGSISFDGQCFDIAINDQAGNLSGFGAEIPDRINTCDPDLANALGGGLDGGLGAVQPPDTPDFLADLGAANTGIVAVEEGGKWYVSPTETLGDMMLEGLKMWDADTLQQYIEWVIELGMETSPGLSF